jgi:(5-formylfuran-3-yl)methyl phosphate synthase
MTRMLASVLNVKEVDLALELGADIIDLKDPTQGALGALPLDTLHTIVQRIGARRTLSATVGDLPMDPALLSDAAARTAATGVDIIKIGFLNDADAPRCVAALAPLAMRTKLVAVLFADRPLNLNLVGEVARAGFFGVMLDTAAKGAGGLRRHMAETQLSEFLQQARARRLLCGLAGSLRLADIGPLLALRPDYLGFRGALCADGDRVAPLNREAMQRIRRAIPAALARDHGSIPA